MSDTDDPRNVIVRLTTDGNFSLSLRARLPKAIGGNDELTGVDVRSVFDEFTEAEMRALVYEAWCEADTTPQIVREDDVCGWYVTNEYDYTPRIDIPRCTPRGSQRCTRASRCTSAAPRW